MTFMKGSVFRTWLVSYAVTLLVPTIIAGLVYFRTVSFVRNEVESANRIVLNQIRDEVDRHFEDLHRFSLQISLNERVQTLMYSSPPLDEYHRLRITTLMRDLRFYSATSGVMDGMILYFRKPDFFLTTEAYRTPDEFFAIEGAEFRDLEESIPEWLNGPQHGLITLLLSAENQSTGIQSIEAQSDTGVPVFIQSFPVTSQTPSALIIFPLDLEECLSSLKLVSMLTSGYFSITNDRDEILYYSAVQDGPVYDTETLEFSGRQSDRSAPRSPASLSEMITYVADSEVTSLNYSFYIPASVFWERARYIRNLTLFSLFLSIVLCAVVAYLFAKRNYSPVETLVALFRSGKQKQSQPRSQTNELEYIKDEITHTLTEIQDYRERIERQKGIIRTRRLTELLRGRIRIDEETLREFHSLGLNLVPERFGVYCFFRNESEHSASFKATSFDGDNGEKSKTADRLSEIEVLITRAVEAVTSDGIDTYYTEVNGIPTILVHLDSSENSDKRLRWTAENGKNRIEKVLGCTLTVGLSRVHWSTSELPLAFQEASEALEYRFVSGNNRIIPYDELETKKFSYHYSIKDEERLLNAIKTGDLESAVALIDTVLETNSEGRWLSIDSARCLMFDLSGTMVKAMNHLDSVTLDTLLHELSPVHTLTHAETLHQMRERLIEILRRVCDEVEQLKRSHNTELRDQIAEFLEGHIGDPSFTIYDVATAFEMDADYISRFFKEQTGMTIPACLQKRRLDEAKRLLRDTDMTVKEISGRIGYYTSAVFIRAFKREEGITPGRFKQSESMR